MTINTITKKLFFNEEKTWITADPHIGHDKIRKFCSRPFPDVEQMDAEIMKNLQECVGPEDTLIVLGDVTFNRKNDNDVKSLPGRQKILVNGNHEKTAISASPVWTRACDYLESVFGMEDGTKQRVVMCHYPMVSWNGARTSFHLHGHTHGIVKPVATEFGGRVDAGVDVWDFRPIRLRDAIARLDALRKTGFAMPGTDY